MLNKSSPDIRKTKRSINLNQPGYLTPTEYSITLDAFYLMLQQNQISNLLKSALSSPSSSSSSNTSIPKFRSISISLLSNHGNPLISLSTKSQSPQSQVKGDNYRSQSHSQLQSLHSSKAGTPTTGGDEYEQSFNIGTNPSFSQVSASEEGQNNEITSDQLKIYSLIAYNSTIESSDSNEANDEQDWSIVDFGNVRCIISKVDLDHTTSKQHNTGGTHGRNENGQAIKRKVGSNTIDITENATKVEVEAEAGDNDDVSDYDRDDSGTLFNGYFVVLFYQKSTPTATSNEANKSTELESQGEVEVDAIAKVKIDSVVDALTQGLRGYHEMTAY
ncbi:hypothetical protein CANMA_000756 [Candida margitis]|uniref:uncharacterized protein n=1 Tax=Candida margitis TaxID=1775924 RepID=UPI0022275D5B|nr:uncharacterized protein CANMA_000756 [Candida margitis]KAI5970145.1 hypothetical protein CANMA_000756 [Candida margitis]